MDCERWQVVLMCAFRGSLNFDNDFLEGFQTVDMVERNESQGPENGHQNLGPSFVQRRFQATQAPFRVLET